MACTARFAPAWLLGLGLLGLPACDLTSPGAVLDAGAISVGRPGTPGSPGKGNKGNDAGGSAAGNNGGGGNNVKTPGWCAAQPSQCTDGKDNDGDGKIDADDPECVGACDNDERTFATGMPGDNKDDLRSCHQDCFFDGNSGQGDDGCRWDLRCDSARAGAAQCPYTPDKPGIKCDPPSQACVNRCRSVTPNGCDCFGCCAVPGKDFAVKLSAACTAATLDDPTKCARCTQVPSCNNPCEKCETCFGKPAVDPSCNPTSPPSPPSGAGGASGAGGSAGGGGQGGSEPAPPRCYNGVTSCGPGGQVPVSGCPPETTCNNGCCLPQLVVE